MCHPVTQVYTHFSTCTYSPDGGHTLHTAALCVCGTLVASYWLFQRKPVNRDEDDGVFTSGLLDSNEYGRRTCRTGSFSHQGDVPVPRSQQLQDHLDLLEGWVTCIPHLLTLHSQRAWVNVGSCAPAEVLLLVNAAVSRQTEQFIKHTHPVSRSCSYYRTGGSAAKSKASEF